MDKIGHREVVEFAGYLINEETLIMNYITMAIVILIAILASRNLKEVPTGGRTQSRPLPRCGRKRSIS